MNLSETVAFFLHEQWRQEGAKNGENHLCKPRWCIIEDQNYISKLDENNLPIYVKKDKGIYKIDIANVPYDKLSPDWQQENRDAAIFAWSLAESGKEYSRDEIGKMIHDAWLERNPDDWGTPLAKPYEELSKVEQDKDILQYDIAKAIHDAVPYRFDAVGDINAITKKLKEFKDKGENVVLYVGDQEYYSLFDNKDTIVYKVTGKTLQEQQNTTTSINTILEIQEKIQGYLPVQKYKDWNNCVRDLASTPHTKQYFVNGAKIIDALEQGMSYKDAEKLLLELDRSAGGSGVIIKMIAMFSNRGPEFLRASHIELSDKQKALVDTMEEVNEYFEAESDYSTPSL